MAKKYLNRAWMTTATTGTGPVTLGSAFGNEYFTFAEAGIANADTANYVIIDGTDVEIGLGTYTSSGTTFSRDTVIASRVSGTAGTGKLNLSGSASIFLTDTAADAQAVYDDLLNLAANSVLARAASSAGAVSGVALSASNLLGRGSTGDVAAISLGASLTMSGTTLSGTTASDTQAGVVELATTSETTTGTDTSRAVTPAGVHSAILGTTRLIGIGVITSAATVDYTNIGGPYSSILIVYQGTGTATAARTLQVALSEDNGGSFGTARTVASLSTTAGNFTMGAATISDTANTATNKTITPAAVGMNDVDATVTSNTYTTVATETVKTGVIDALRLSVSGATCSYAYQLYGVR